MDSIQSQSEVVISHETRSFFSFNLLGKVEFYAGLFLCRTEFDANYM